MFTKKNIHSYVGHDLVSPEGSIISITSTSEDTITYNGRYDTSTVNMIDFLRDVNEDGWKVIVDTDLGELQ